MGKQGTYIKVYTDAQWYTMTFDAANIKGAITHVVKVGDTDDFVVNNIDDYFSFTCVANDGGKTAADIAVVGDSLIKSSYADTFLLVRKDTRQYFKFAFVRR